MHMVDTVVSHTQCPNYTKDANILILSVDYPEQGQGSGGLAETEECSTSPMYKRLPDHLTN